MNHAIHADLSIDTHCSLFSFSYHVGRSPGTTGEDSTQARVPPSDKSAASNFREISLDLPEAGIYYPPKYYSS